MADLSGETIQISRQAPSVPFETGPFSYRVGLSLPVALSGGNNLYASTTSTDLLLTFGPLGGYGGPLEPLQHFVLFDNLFAGTSTIITGVTFITDLSGFDASDLVFTDHSVKIGHGQLTWTGGQTLDVTLLFDTIPEPSAFALAGLGVVALITYRRRIQPANNAVD